MNEFQGNASNVNSFDAANSDGTPSNPLLEQWGMKDSSQLQQLPLELPQPSLLQPQVFNPLEDWGVLRSQPGVEEDPNQTEWTGAEAQLEPTLIGSQSRDHLTGKVIIASLVQDEDTASTAFDGDEFAWGETQSSESEELSGAIEPDIPSPLPSLGIRGTGNYQALVADAVTQVKDQLQQLATDPALISMMQQAFGQAWEPEAGRALIQQVLNDDPTRLPILRFEVVAQSNLQFQGGFAAQSNTIYFSTSFLTESAATPNLLAAVLLEEIGHYFDAQLNSTDSPGDEGEIFSRLVQGQAIGEPEWQRLKTEDDSAILLLEGQPIAIEEAAIYGTPNPDTLQGTSENDQLYGGDGNDTLYGGAGNDALYGGGGNDVLDGGTGNDQMVGGTGDDVYAVDSAYDTIVEDANGGTDWVGAHVSFSIASFNNVEHLYLWSNATNGDGNSLNNYIQGNTTNNVLSGFAGNDTLDGGAGNDTLDGGTGNDTLDGGTGNDQMVGGSGDDVYAVDSAYDTIVEDANGGYDSVGAHVSFSIASFNNVENLFLWSTVATNGDGNSLNNFIQGNAANNVLSGFAGNDTLDGGTGNDQMNGGTGDDTYYLVVPEKSRGQAVD
jgi:Ca2+-binding RTX toxin-like protein